MTTMFPSLDQNQPIDIKKMIEAIDMRYVSGNSIPIERAAIRTWEWNEIKRLLAEKGYTNVTK